MLYGVWVARLVVIWCLSGCGLVFGCWLFFFFGVVFALLRCVWWWVVMVATSLLER